MVLTVFAWRTDVSACSGKVAILKNPNQSSILLCYRRSEKSGDWLLAKNPVLHKDLSRQVAQDVPSDSTLDHPNDMRIVAV
jgi:hypothetical protein